MKPAPFEYHRPASLAETFDLLDRYGGDGRVLAGGQSLVPTLNMRLMAPRAIIDINRLPGLDAIRVTPDALVIGALLRQEAIGTSALVAEHAPLIAAAIPHIGHAAIRARGTLGGSLALADPAAELPACAVALRATIRVTGRGGVRDVAAADFFHGIYTTALGGGELVTEVAVPRAAGWRWGFEELSRRHGDFALAGLAAGLRLDGGTVAEARLGFFGLGTTPVPARADAPALAAAGGALDGDLDPPGDIHGSPALRRHLAWVLLARVVGRLTEGRS